jgi:hypothetical protein
MLINLTVCIDERILSCAREKAEALGKSLDQVIRDYLKQLAGEDDPEGSIEEFERLSASGDSRALHFDRNEIHERS